MKCFAQNTIHNRNELLKHPVYTLFFRIKRGQLFETGDYFNQILLTGIRLLNISFYYLIESKYDHIK